MNYTPPVFQPLQYIPAGQRETILNSPVHYLSAVAHGRLDTGGNHWCFYLAIGGTRSVQLDMTPSYTVPSTSIRGGSKGILVISALNCLVSDATTKQVRLDVRSGLKVADFVNLLEGQKRHHYEFNDQGQGCRYWVDDQMTLFQRSGLVTNPAQVVEAKASILTQYPDQAQYPLVPSAYYD
ncbi:hypothetical protein BJX76DRAFT_367865 [Aspergillus varians]